MDNKDGTLTISNPQAGIADSPLFGFAKMQNLEVREKPGIAKIQYASQLYQSTTSLPVCILIDSYGGINVGCADGKFYRNGALVGTVTDPNKVTIYDMKLISDGTALGEYIIITVQSGFSIYGPTNPAAPGGGSLNNGWLSVTDLDFNFGHPMLVGLDTSSNNTPIVYVGNGNSIASITGFTTSPGPIPTASCNRHALYLSPGHYAKTLASLGKYLCIGTQGGQNYADFINSKTAGLFYWDRTSPSFNLPILFSENGVNQLLQLQNRLYIVVGTRGKVYITDSTNYTLVKKIPFSFNRNFGTTITPYPNAIGLHLGEMLIGLSAFNPDSTTTLGIYSINVDDPTYPIVLRNTPSSGGNGQGNTLIIGALTSTSQDVLVFGWQDGASFGVDVVSKGAIIYYTNFKAYFESEFYPVGTQLNKKSFKRMECSLTKPLTGNQQIRISYKENSDDSYEVLALLTAANFGTSNVFNTIANLASKVKLQFKVEFTQPANTAYPTNIEFESLTFN